MAKYYAVFQNPTAGQPILFGFPVNKDLRIEFGSRVYTDPLRGKMQIPLV